MTKYNNILHIVLFFLKGICSKHKAYLDILFLQKVTIICTKFKGLQELIPPLKGARGMFSSKILKYLGKYRLNIPPTPFKGGESPCKSLIFLQKINVPKFAKLLPLVILLCICQSTVYSQGGEIFNKITSREGINQSIVYSINQDQYGNIWAGTEEGVIRFNSMESFLYNKYKGLPANASDRITTLFIDSKNRIWIGLEKGIALYNPEKNIFEDLFLDKTIKPNLVSTIIEDTQGSIWIGAFNGVWKYTLKTKKS